MLIYPRYFNRRTVIIRRNRSVLLRQCSGIRPFLYVTRNLLDGDGASGCPVGHGPRRFPLASSTGPCVCQNEEEGGSGYPSSVALPDGNLLVAGWEASDLDGFDFVAVKIDPSDGSLIWKWKVSSRPTRLRCCVMALPGGILRASRGDGWR